MTVKVRTDGCCTSLIEWPYLRHQLRNLPNFAELQLHYFTNGISDSNRVLLCPHSQQTWVYLYHKMIPIFATLGASLVAQIYSVLVTQTNLWKRQPKGLHSNVRC